MAKRTQKAKDAKSLQRQVVERLSSMCRYGQSRYRDKQTGNAESGIYSRSTYETYAREAKAFARWVEQTHAEHNIDAARAYAKEYIQQRNADPKLSAWSVKTSAAALGKLYNCKTTDFGPTRGRSREDITRSRGEATRDKHFSEDRHMDLVNFCKGTGLRRHEVEKVIGTDFNKEHGTITVKGKGGKVREVKVLPEYREQIAAKMERAGSGKVWGKVSSAADIHAYRSQYATALYNRIARPIDQIPPQDRYFCRGDKAGIVYDRKAMELVSKCMGHTRVSVIAAHYLRAGDESC